MDPGDGLDGAEWQWLVHLALADWSEAADARVDSGIVSRRPAVVSLFGHGGYRCSVHSQCPVHFQRDEHEQWDEAGSSSGRADRAEWEPWPRGSSREPCSAHPAAGPVVARARRGAWWLPARLDGGSRTGPLPGVDD